MMHIVCKFLHIYPADIYRKFTEAASMADRSSKKSRYLADFTQSSRSFSVINKRDIFPTKDLPFENIMISVPGNIEKYVKEICCEYI